MNDQHAWNIQVIELKNKILEVMLLKQRYPVFVLVRFVSYGKVPFPNRIPGDGRRKSKQPIMPLVQRNGDYAVTLDSAQGVISTLE
jgi:hypothetical protein